MSDSTDYGYIPPDSYFDDTGYIPDDSKFELVPKSSSPAPSEGGDGYTKPGFGGIGFDVLNSVLNTPGAAAEMAMDLPGQLSSAGGYIKRHPVDAFVRQPLLALDEGVSGIMSAPQLLARYLAEKGGYPNSRFHRNPTPYEMVREEERRANWLPKEEGEGALRGFEQLGLGGPISKLPSALSRMGSVTSQFAGQGGDPIHALMASFLGEKGVPAASKKIKSLNQTRKDIKGLPSKEGELRDVDYEAQQQKAAISAIEKELNKKYGAKTSEGLEGVANATARKIEDNPFAQKGYEFEPKGEGEQAPKARQSHEDLLGEAKKYLHADDEPHVMASKAFPEAFETHIKKPAQKAYEDISTDLENQKIPAPPSELKGIKDSISQLNERLSEPGWGRALKDAFKLEVSELNAAKNVNAKDYYNAYRSARQTASSLRSDAYRRAPTANDFDRLMDKAKALDETAAQMASYLKKFDIGEKALKDLEKANTQWRRVKEVEENSLYKDMARTGRAKNIIERLSGHEVGLNHLHDLMKKEPELAKLSLASKYSEKPLDLLKLNTREKGYAEDAPGMGNVRDSLSSSLDRIKKAELYDLQRTLEDLNKQEARLQAEKSKLDQKQDKAKEIAKEIEVIKEKQSKLKKKIKTAMQVGATALGYEGITTALQRVLQGKK